MTPHGRNDKGLSTTVPYLVHNRPDHLVDAIDTATSGRDSDPPAGKYSFADVTVLKLL